MKYFVAIAVLIAGTYHAGVSACSFVLATEVEFSQGSSALQADQVLRLADFVIRIRQGFSSEGSIVLTATAKPNELHQKELAQARLQAIRMYLDGTHYAGTVHEDMFLYRQHPSHGESGRTVGLQFVPSQPIRCPEPLT